MATIPKVITRAKPIPPKALRDFFIYGTGVVTMAAAATGNATIQVQADAAFELQKLAFFADIAGAAQTDSTRVLPLVTVQITDQGSGRQLFSVAVPIPAMMGDGTMPFILPVTKIFAANSAISLDFVNYSAATTYNVRTLLIGSKIFNFS